MKKHLIALAALAGSSAFAQSTLDWYAYGDLGVGQSIGQNEKFQFNPGTADVGGIRFGAKGSRELNGGLKVSIQLETNAINEAGTGDGGYGRAAWVGLSGDFGEVRLGRQVRNAVLAEILSSPSGWRGTTPPEPAAGIRYSVNNNISVSTRSSAMVNYISPDVGGLKVRLGVVPGADLAPGVGDLVDLGLFYSKGPLELSFGYLKSASYDGNYGLQSTYDFGPVKLYGGYHHVGSTLAVATAQTFKLNTTTGLIVIDNVASAGKSVEASDGYNLGLSIPVGRAKIYTSYAYNTTTAFDGYELGVDYSLDKSTALNFAIANAKNQTAGYFVGLRFSF